MPRKPRTKKAALVPEVVAAFPVPAGGVEPRGLEASAARTLRSAEDSVALWEQLRPLATEFAATLGEVVQKHRAALQGQQVDAQLVRDSNAVMTSLITFLEKMTRCGMNMVKATDELARLGAFLTKGEDAPEMGDMTIPELQAMVDRMATGRDG